MRSLYIIAAVLFFTGVKHIYGGLTTSKLAKYPKGRLLTPEEGCGLSNVPQKRIVGGSVAKNGAWPWMALLYYAMENFPSCGGSLITTRHVLTAAHCITDELYMVRLGEYNTSTTEDGEHLDVGIADTEAHGNWNLRWLMNDIGMVYLDEDVVFNDRIRPVCLPFTDDLLKRRFVDSNAFLVGWGRTGEKGKESNVPLQVQVPIIENKVCKESYFRINSTIFQRDSQFDERVICDGFTKGGKGSCQGDSGGPLVLPIAGKNGVFPFYQIGIVSYSKGCGRPNTPEINTSVQTFAGWIQDKINNHN